MLDGAGTRTPLKRFLLDWDPFPVGAPPFALFAKGGNGKSCTQRADPHMRVMDSVLALHATARFQNCHGDLRIVMLSAAKHLLLNLRPK